MTEPADPTADALATPGALRTALRGAPVPDELAAQLISEASAVVRAHCGWRITGPVTETFLVDGPGTQTLLLPTLALVEVLAVTDDGRALAPGDLEWSAAGMLRRRDRRPWTDRFSGITVVARHGVDAVPDSVAAVVLAIAKRAYANPTGAQAAAAGIVTDTFGAAHGPVALTALERDLLAPWRAR